jgi:cobalamin biosynthesis Mg chelatase CobN
MIFSLSLMAQVDSLDKIELKNSKIITGQVVKITSNTVEFREALTKLLYEYQKSEIKSLTLSNGTVLSFNTPAEQGNVTGSMQNNNATQGTNTQTSGTQNQNPSSSTTQSTTAPSTTSQQPGSGTNVTQGSTTTTQPSGSSTTTTNSGTQKTNTDRQSQQTSNQQTSNQQTGNEQQQQHGLSTTALILLGASGMIVLLLLGKAIF